MKFRLLDKGWDRTLDAALNADQSQVRIVCPFIKLRAATRFLRHGKPDTFQVITRFNLDCFREGVSDAVALRYLMDNGAQIRGIKNLHAKAYLIGKSRAIVTSANLTEQALVRNHEFGFDAGDPEIVANCHAYFDRLWKLAGPDLVASTIDGWERKLAAARVVHNTNGQGPSLGDDGVDVGFVQDSGETPTITNSAEQGFVKFFGLGNDRADAAMTVLEEVNSSTSHWALSYPATKTPRQVEDGALMFIARLVAPDDIRIYGRGIGSAYRPGRDDATPGDIAKREWKRRWSRYIQVRNVEFVDATLADCVSLNDLMTQLGPASFATTNARYLRGERDIRLRATYARKAQIQLTPEAIVWLNEQLERRFDRFGKISKGALDNLIQPEP